MGRWACRQAAQVKGSDHSASLACGISDLNEQGQAFCARGLKANPRACVFREGCSSSRTGILTPDSEVS